MNPLKVVAILALLIAVVVVVLFLANVLNFERTMGLELTDFVGFYAAKYVLP